MLQASGPFLLRHEIDEIQSATRLASEANSGMAFKSDFLEPVLNFQIKKSDVDGQLVAHLIFKLPKEQSSNNITQTVSAEFSLSPGALKKFSDALEIQLDAFPSLL